jgi:hypothetical protein
MSANPPDDIAVTEHTAPGVSYIRIEGARDRYFRCEPYRATLSVSSCAERWRRAQQSPVACGDDRLEKCRSCPIGARHNGVDPVYRSPLWGKPICPRARTWTSRMIFDRLGISMYNRQAEFVKQRNGKNRPPQFRFDPRRLAVIIDGARQELRDDLTADLTEMVVQVLRTVPGKLVFTRARVGAPAISTIELAERFRPKGDERHQMGTYRQRQRTEIANEARRQRHAAAPVVAAE